jgi:hypothetical protein
MDQFARYKGAILDTTGMYRYALWRIWDEQKPHMAFILLNPSTADAYQDDPTLRRCISFVHSFGGGSLEIVNLFAFRSPYPEALLSAHDPVGPENDVHILYAVKRATYVICGWGALPKRLTTRVKDMHRLLKNYSLFCLGMTQTTKQPRHPLYLPGKTAMEKYLVEE